MAQVELDLGALDIEQGAGDRMDVRRALEQLAGARDPPAASAARSLKRSAWLGGEQRAHRLAVAGTELARQHA